VDSTTLLGVLSKNILDDADRQFKLDLENNIDNAIQSLGGRAFVKLSTRSAKDAVDKPQVRARDVLHGELVDTLRQCFPAFPSPEAFVHAIRRTFALTMSVGNGERALMLFSLSNRIISDLRRCSMLFEQHMCVVVRQFVSLPLYCEIRCFVYQRKLTCATQYDATLFFPELQSNHESRVSRLKAFVDCVIKTLPSNVYDNFILDVALIDDPGSAAVLVELNPFGKLTGK
jgi:hypothetical protein